MTKYTSLFMLGLFVLLFTVSCSDQTNTTNITIDTDITRSARGHSTQVNFQGQMVTLEAGDMIGVAKAMNADNADAQDIMNMNAALMGTEKEAQLLDVDFTMSDDPVENGMFIFGVETKDAKDLTLEMFDEEGFAMVANNKFEVTEGNNYKALNVQSLDAGSYNFRLKDDAGKELNRVVTVSEK
ncbi:MAG: Unknown protein [uncultured Aureispira sp.]|uniref:Secretion system C-terminal sorting domain-containing protein n=1 Tax=uncultured Aureispira sp. TaxID=1331704 RepID=A0A6S6TJ11_9BACT|nr:MAG: Unknown protein [uncultured Aureispira sp.]